MAIASRDRGAGLAARAAALGARRPRRARGLDRGVVVFFWDAVSLRGVAASISTSPRSTIPTATSSPRSCAGRFSRWCPGLYCGLPLYSESQAGYLHPLKYLFYPWLPTWQAFNLDTVLSVWLTGLGTYGWLRRHVGPSGALTGAAVFGLSGFVWAHLIHTSMNNALTSVPFAVWALEVAWEGRRLGAIVLGAVALACQVFAGHLQDTILTSGLIGLYGLYRAATERVRGPAPAGAGDGGRPGRRWGWCWRPCSGSPRRSCSTARPAPGA